MSTTRLDQRRQALRLANGVRAAASGVRLELGAGLLPLADAMYDRRSDPMHIYDLLCCVRGIGPVTARKLLWRRQIRETRRVRELTIREKGLLLADVVREGVR